LNAFKPEFLITSCSEARLTSISREITDFRQSFYTCKDGAITAVINPQGKIRFEPFK